MKYSEEQLDHLLGALREAQPPRGMEQRVLARLEQRAAVPAPKWNKLFVFAPVAVAACAVVVAMMMGLSRSQGGKTVVGGATIAQATPMVVQATPVVHSGSAGFVADRPLVAGHVSGPAGLVRTDWGTANVDPAFLPSFPAPAEPLTRDERQLVRAARHITTVEVAQMEPPARPDSVTRYIEHMLAPLVTAESFRPTASAEPETPATPVQDTDSSSSETETQP